MDVLSANNRQIVTVKVDEEMQSLSEFKNTIYQLGNNGKNACGSYNGQKYAYNSSSNCVVRC